MTTVDMSSIRKRIAERSRRMRRAAHIRLQLQRVVAYQEKERKKTEAARRSRLRAVANWHNHAASKEQPSSQKPRATRVSFAPSVQVSQIPVAADQILPPPVSAPIGVALRPRSPLPDTSLSLRAAILYAKYCSNRPNDSDSGSDGDAINMDQSSSLLRLSHTAQLIADLTENDGEDDSDQVDPDFVPVLDSVSESNISAPAVLTRARSPQPKRVVPDQLSTKPTLVKTVCDKRPRAHLEVTDVPSGSSLPVSLSSIHSGKSTPESENDADSDDGFICEDSSESHFNGADSARNLSKTTGKGKCLDEASTSSITDSRSKGADAAPQAKRRKLSLSSTASCSDNAGITSDNTSCKPSNPACPQTSTSDLRSASEEQYGDDGPGDAGNGDLVMQAENKDHEIGSNLNDVISSHADSTKKRNGMKAGADALGAPVRASSSTLNGLPCKEIETCDTLPNGRHSKTTQVKLPKEESKENGIGLLDRSAGIATLPKKPNGTNLERSSKQEESSDGSDDDADLDGLFSTISKRKAEVRRAKTVKASEKMRKDDVGNSSGPGHSNMSPKKGRQYTEEGYRILTMDEIKADQPEGLNGECPFDCSCCF